MCEILFFFKHLDNGFDSCWTLRVSVLVSMLEHPYVTYYTSLQILHILYLLYSFIYFLVYNSIKKVIIPPLAKYKLLFS